MEKSFNVAVLVHSYIVMLWLVEQYESTKVLYLNVYLHFKIAIDISGKLVEFQTASSYIVQVELWFLFASPLNFNGSLKNK